MEHKVLPKQTDINEVIKFTERKSLKGINLPITIKELQAGYLTSSYFESIYIFYKMSYLPLRPQYSKYKTDIKLFTA